MKTPRRNPLEWGVFAVCLALVSAVVLYLAYSAARSSEAPPRLAVEVGEVEQAPDGFTVAVTVANEGDTTAASVLIEVRAGADPDAERGEVTLDLVPRGSSRRAWVSLRRQPIPGQIQARVLGYEEP